MVQKYQFLLFLTIIKYLLDIYYSIFGG